MRFINLTSARKLKADLNEKIENLGENREATPGHLLWKSQQIIYQTGGFEPHPALL